MTMDDMKHARTDPLSVGQWVLSLVAGLLMLGLAALAFRGMFSSVRAEMVPFFGSIAWTVPIGVDLGIVILILVSILLEWLAMPMPMLRHIAAFFMGCTVWLNVLAAHGQVPGIVGHLSLPVLFIASVEAVRHAVRRRSGLAAGNVREGIPVARWLLAPAATFLLWRRMVLWQVTSYRVALDREQLRRRTIARLRAEHGDRWKADADSAVVWHLVQGIDVEAAAAELDAAAERKKTAALAEVQGPRPAVNKRRSSGRKPARGSGRAKPASSALNAPGVPADVDTQAEALRILAAEPDISGGELGRRLGVSESYGCRLKRDLTRTAAPAAEQVADA